MAEPESVESRLARSEAPILAAFVRRPPRAPAGAGAPPPPARASKAAGRRERAARAPGACAAFLRGACPRPAAECRFSHDLAAFFAEKAPDVPGPCPLDAPARPCPYGVACRWAGAHAGAAAAAALALAAEAPAGPVAAPAAAPESAPLAPPGGPPPPGFWFRGDATVPAGALPLPPAADVSPAGAAVNVLSKDVQMKLRHGEYDFGRADATLRALGLEPPAPRGAGGRGGRGGRGGKRSREEEDAAAAAATAEAAVEPAAAEPEAAEPAADAGFVAALGEPAAAAAAADAAAAAAVAAPAAAPNAAPAPDGGADFIETPLPPRERPALDLRGKRFLAPLTTVGNLPFRRLCVGLGAEVTCGEMALATNVLAAQASEWALLRRHPSEKCFGVQLAGAHPDAIARAAQLVEDTCSVDFIDLNFGCPIDVVVGRGAGAAALARPARLAQLVRAAAGAAAATPLTLKMRKGFKVCYGC
jgi:tRNA-dihydrouridine synthase 3